ncbi:MAG: EamA family transporter [Phycisphaera sp. RhM]|nr:EamA family transporter [Phycisphaera sp. RhM]
MNWFRPLLSSWQFWAFLSALFAALTAVFAKLGVKKIPPDVATFVRTIVILIFVMAMLWLTSQFGIVKTLSRRAIAFLALSGLATGASWICYFRALDLGKASQVASIDKLSVVMVAIIAAIFLHERLPPMAITGVALITIGTILVALAG